MIASLIQIVIKGLVGGALAGFLIGAYVVNVTQNHVIPYDLIWQPVAQQYVQDRYRAVVVLAFMITFAAIGPVIAAGSFGPWLRHATYGLVAAVGMVVLVTLIGAAFSNEQPFNMNKMSHGTWIYYARVYAVPVALILGPISGILIGRALGRPPVTVSGLPANST